jgi:hypothetical protein
VAFISVTRLRLRSLRFIPGLYWETGKISRFLETAPGFLGGKLLADRHRTFWTMSVWKDAESMRAFRNSRVHAAVIPKVNQWCDEASVVHWETGDGRLPDWIEAWRRMIESGRPMPLTFQSTDHKARRIRKPRTTNGRDIVPRPRPSRETTEGSNLYERST